MPLVLQQVNRVYVAAQRSLVLELRQTFLALVGKIVRVDLDVFSPVRLFQEAFRANSAPIFGEREACPVADMPGQRRRMLELFQTVRALMGTVVVTRVLRQPGGSFEGLWAVTATVLAITGYTNRCDNHRRWDQLWSGSLHPNG